jgi:integrase
MDRAVRSGLDMPVIRLHDLATRTPPCWAGEPVHVVSQRLGHASVVVTLTVYAHVLPGDQKRAHSRFAELVEVA